MELHSEITYHLTTFDFKYLTYVEHWHGKVEPTYKTYAEFKEEIENKLNKESLRERFQYLVDEAYENAEFEGFGELYDDNREELSNLLKEFYPILKCEPSGAFETSIDDIIDNIVIPYIQS